MALGLMHTLYHVLASQGKLCIMRVLLASQDKLCFMRVLLASQGKLFTGFTRQTLSSGYCWLPKLMQSSQIGFKILFFVHGLLFIYPGLNHINYLIGREAI